MALAARGNRVVTLDLLGHGRSDRPPDMWRYSMSAFGAEVIALLDHLGVDEAVVLGTSLGANTTLEAAALAPERLRGMVIEMPVLDNALLGSALAFTPLMVALTAGAPVMRVISAVTRRVPRLPWQLDILLDTVRQAPEPSAAVLQGLFFGRTAPHRSERRTFETPALVIGHQFDIVHPFSDAGMLAEELPNGRLVRGELDPRAAAGARAPDGRDRGVRGRVLAPAAGQAPRAAHRQGAGVLRLADLREAADRRHQLVELGLGLGLGRCRPPRRRRSGARGRRGR